ncbi:PR domain zinc finger protein 5-like [Folsomia candida]|nr:PR domain zinc finger protein 5-like [Folsomia candida]XP_035712355.1 PR domain zinc finger protein 5-like [Folsomia candida]
MDAREGNELTCSTCFKTFSTKGNLKYHMVTHDADAKVKCEICGKFFKTPLSLSQHKKLLHTSRDRPSCDICHRVFSSPRNLRSHIDTVHDTAKRLRFPCEFPGCAKTYLTRNAMLKHKRTEHSENPTRFPCTLCSKEFKTRTDLEAHISTHTTEKAYKCCTCGRRFTQRTTMRSHQATHMKKYTRRIFKCNLCPKTFLRKATLHAHSQVVHENRRNHPCTFCDKRFSTATVLRHHVEARHPANKEKIYSCNKCQFMTPAKEYLVQHVRRHNPAYRRECYFCKKQLVSFSSLIARTYLIAQIANVNIRHL